MTGARVRGVDGCVGGWFAISLDPNGGQPTSRVFPDATALFEGDDWTVTAIDVPIGLPSQGPRECDVGARRLLQDRRSSVFPAPLRCTLSVDTYEDACRLSAAVSGKKLSKQAFAILPKIRQVDNVLRCHPLKVAGLREVHPEVCFTYWNGGRPMQYAKRSGFGFIERFRLIEQAFPGSAERFRNEHPANEDSDDDILDALAALWTALRLHASTAVRIAPEEARDEVGLSMNIWV